MSEEKTTKENFSNLVYSHDKMGNDIYQLGPSVKMEAVKVLHTVSTKRYKKKVKGQVDDWKFESDGQWCVALPERFRALKLSQVLEIPHLVIMSGKNQRFHKNYRLVLSPIRNNMVNVNLYMKSIPEEFSDVNTVEYLKAFKERLWTRSLSISQYDDEEDEKTYMPFVMFSVKARTVAEVCKVVEIFLDEIENETKGTLNLN